MFFKWQRGDRSSDTRSSVTAEPASLEPAPVAKTLRPDPAQMATPQAPLKAAALRRRIDPAKLGFASTAELEPTGGAIGQDRALRAIEFGAGMRAHDFNMFVLGPPAAGKRAAVHGFLSKRAGADTPPFDWVYVNNFIDPNRPRALKLPCGRGRLLQQAMTATIDELRTSVPTLFEGEEYQARRRAIDEEFRSSQEGAFEAVNARAQSQNIAILRTPTGFAMAPMHEGKVVKPETFSMLPDAYRKDVEAKIEALQQELAQILERVPKLEKQRRARTSDLNEETGTIAVREALDEARAAFADLPEVAAHIEIMAKDLVRNIATFLSSGEDGEAIKSQVDSARDPRFRRYMINLLVANADDTCIAPIHEELNPTHGNLIGRVEYIAQMGAMLTDFLLIKPGALHKANGGTLMIDARKLLLSPFCWEALKRSIKARQVRFEHPSEQVGLMQTQTLDPDPIPLDIKIVLFGDRELYYLLAANDPDFPLLFKVQADFDDSIAFNADNERDYARLIASIVKEHGLSAVSADGVARLIEEASRLADDRDKLSVEIGRIADIVREADYWAKKEGAKLITRDHVARAIEEQIQRSDRMRDRALEMITREIVMIETSGAKVGQINALSVLQLGSFSFGRPSRITARVRMGTGRVLDIEREVNLGGPLHSKGVMILWGFLAGRFAEDIPLALAATLVFEQSYGGVDGDSASSTELYALLSALAEAPISQSMAVTGSVNQWGEVQAIGGVNQKIEGFYDVCKARGLTGEQGVLIPSANLQHLVLREDVVAAVAAGKFSVWPVAHVDQGIELLTGIAAGRRQDDGAYPTGTINARVEARLRRFADHARKFGKAAGGERADDDRPAANGRDVS